MRRIAAIASNTFRECVRDKVLYNLILFAFLLIGAAILFGQISIGVQQIILVNLGLTSVSIFGLAMAIFIGIGLVYKEMDKRTLYSLLAKPVHRYEFILGKFFGLGLTLLVNTSIMTVGFFVALYYLRRSFQASDFYLLVAIYLIFLQLLLITAFALFFSCFSTPILSASFTFGLYVIGTLASDIRLFGKATESPFMEQLTTAIYYLLPNFSNFNVITTVAHENPVPGSAILYASVYGLAYTAFVLLASALVFQNRNLR